MVNKRIREARKALGLTQKEFAHCLRIGDSSLSKIEKGINNPSAQTVDLICRTFHINEDWLLYDIGEMFEKDYILTRHALAGQDEEFIDIVYRISKMENGWDKLKEAATCLQSIENLSPQDAYNAGFRMGMQFKQYESEHSEE